MADELSSDEKEKIEALLHWSNLSDTLKQVTEEECMALLVYEKANANRATTLKRLHHRYNLLRGRREKGELIKR